ncbi:MAG: hypothetical protein L0332_17500 [Chloroflexi bacterium]|nr:hypothetical protein [Chloroflexota bacterium]MCI0580329.1 hypothetical protein [Chloroflexota bacterium]MCI0648524.1 hypothetical protein [Chloroflexota bacterium]MCI0728496.1 hypothetical protein [Chloroflexota bacterium]
MLTSRERTQIGLQLGFTAVLLGYLLVWLPQPVVGLSFIGLEMGEWVKFLPQVQAGEVVPGRDLFYLPPMTLGLMMVLWTAGWPNGRWQSWVMRAVAVAVSLLAFPSLDAIRFEPAGQWALRLTLVGLVGLAAVLSSLAGRLPARLAKRMRFGGLVVLGLLGAGLPTWAYLAVRPAARQVLATPVGIGPGVWLNLGGHLLVVAVALIEVLRRPVSDQT